MNKAHRVLAASFGKADWTQWLYILLLIAICSQHLSCSKKMAPFEPTDALGMANKWVYDSLQLYYYWSDQLNKRPDYSLATPEFFRSLLAPADRFSAITNNRDVQPHRSVYELYGFYYSLITHPFDAQQLVGVVTFVLPGSPAAQYLERGDFFIQVNGRVLQKDRVEEVSRQFTEGDPVTLVKALINDQGTQLTEGAAVTVTAGGVPFQSIFTARAFERNGTRTGYLSYLQCIESQDYRVLDAMLRFKQAGVTELILDLRFNPGGSVASCAKLAAMLVPDYNPGQTFITFQGNRSGGTVRQSFQKTISFSAAAPGKTTQELLLRNLNLKRIFILTSGATISAAEILCNNLQPFMQVVRIGSKTYGKDEASFRIEDKRSPKQVPWIMYPIVYKIADANGKGNYSNGLLPDHVVNEFNRLPLQPLGLPGDPLLDQSLMLIYGSTDVGVTPMRNKTFVFEHIQEVYQSAVNATGVEFQHG